jgi:hypothetical protein
MDSDNGVSRPIYFFVRRTSLPESLWKKNVTYLLVEYDRMVKIWKRNKEGNSGVIIALLMNLLDRFANKFVQPLDMGYFLRFKLLDKLQCKFIRTGRGLFLSRP